MNPSIRSCGFTIPNWKQSEWDYLTKLEKNVKFIKIAQEVGENGLSHIQGILGLVSPHRLKWVKKHLRPQKSTDIHLDYPIGDCVTLWKYVGADPGTVFAKGPKTGSVLNVFSRGAPPKGAGHRSDLVEIQEKLDQGAQVSEIAQEHFSTWARNHNSIEKYHRNYSKQAMKRKREPRVAPALLVMVGATGAGKSLLARKIGEQVSSWGFEGIYTLNAGTSGNTWFTGCDEDKDILLIDDFYGWLKWGLLLNICDYWNGSLPVHGGKVHCPHWKLVIITSNIPYDQWYKKQLDSSALLRRITWNLTLDKRMLADIRGLGIWTWSEIWELVARHKVEPVIVGFNLGVTWADQ